MSEERTPPQPQPIAPEEARQRLDTAMRERLGADWEDEHTGWTLVSGHDYMARVTDGRRTVDFYVDLLGEVTIQEQQNVLGAETGRLTAWMVLGASIVVALVIARVAGFL
ncbi:MAG: hypothetical protein ACOCYT_02745 [Chloroflexota bacterium]